MKTNLKSIFSFLALSVSAVMSAQPYTVTAPGYGDVLLTNYSSSVDMVRHTGVAYQQYGGASLDLNVWDHMYNAWSNGAYIQADGTGGSPSIIFPQQIRVNGVNTHAWDPDVEFSEDMTRFAVVFIDDNGVYLQLWEIIGGAWMAPAAATFQLAVQSPSVNPSTPIYSEFTDVNVDYAITNSGDGGIVTWSDGATVWAESFDFNAGPSGNTITVATGHAADVAVCTNSDKCYISYMDGNNDLQVEEDLFSNIIAGTPALSLVTGFGTQKPYWDYTKDVPRIATPHNLSGGLDPEGFSVVFHDLNAQNIVAVTRPSTISTPYVYNIVTGGAHWSPAVCYNEDRVKFIWGSNYFPNPTISGGVGPKDDILLAEYDPTIPVNLHGSGVLFEVNTTSSYFGRMSQPSIAESRDHSFGANADYNAFLYNSDFSPTVGELLKKNLPSITSSKRLAVVSDSDLSLDHIGENYLLQGENLNTYTIELYTLDGKKIVLGDRLIQSENEVEINCSDLTTGIYILSCQSSDKSESFKLTVQ